MQLSALTSSLPLPLVDAVGAIAELGFQWIDLPPTLDPTLPELLLQQNLTVACVALERDQPAGTDLASLDEAVQADSIEYYRQAIVRAEKLGADQAYLTPPLATDSDTLGRWADGLHVLADAAGQQGLRLCVEHFPGRALPTVAATLALIDRLRHPALGLLIDVGHCLISQEDPAQAVAMAGDQLGYVHFDDNDGQSDLHWPLLAGQLTRRQILDTLAALREIDYAGVVSLELNATLDDPLGNLRQSRQLLAECLRETMGAAAGELPGESPESGR